MVAHSNSFLKNVSNHAPYNSLLSIQFSAFSASKFATAVARTFHDVRTFHKLMPSILKLIATPISITGTNNTSIFKIMIITVLYA